MSFILMAQAMKIKTGNPTTKLILLNLCDNANEDGQCWPSYKRIADQCEVDKSTVMRRISVLIKLDLISKTERQAKNGRTTSNMYKIHLSLGVADCNGGGDRLQRGRVAGCDPHYIEPTSKNLLLNQKVIKKAVEICQEGKNNVNFNDFWDAWPPRQNKKLYKAKALEQFKKLTDEQMQACIKGAINFDFHCKKENVWPPDAYRWIRDNCFDEWQELTEDPDNKPSASDPSQQPNKIFVEGVGVLELEDGGE